MQGRALCHECNAKVKADGVGKYMCQKCHAVIDGEPLRFRGEVYHPYHFNCTGILIISVAYPGSEIRYLFDPWIRDPGRIKNPDPDP